MPVDSGILQGVDSGINALIQDRRDVEFGDAILNLEPNAAPITVLLGRLAKKSVHDPEFRWFEEDPIGHYVTLTTGFDSSATSITVPDATIFYEDDVIKATMVNSSGALVEEMMLVTAVNYSTDTLTVTRAYGESTAQNFSGADSDHPIEIVTLGNLSAEGSRAPADRYNQPTVLYNIVGITKTPFSVTGTVDRSRQRANPQERARLQRTFGVKHRKEIEAKILWGERAEVRDGSGNIRRVPKGITSFIQSHKYDLGGTMDYVQLMELAQEIFRYGDQEKWAFCGPTFLTSVATLGLKHLEIGQSEERFGVKYNRLVTPHGDFLLVKHPMFQGPVWSRAALVLDLGSANGERRVQFRPLQNGGDTRLQLNIQLPDEDIVRDQYVTEAGVQVMQERTHALLFNAGLAKGTEEDAGDGED